MANEAIIVELLGNKGDPVRYTCAEGTTIPKGTVLELTTPRTVKLASAVDTPLVGIAAQEKVGGDGATSISVYTNGIFQLKCATTQCEIGDQVSLAAADNTIALSSTLDLEKGWSLGYAMETIALGATGMVRINK